MDDHKPYDILRLLFGDYTCRQPGGGQIWPNLPGSSVNSMNPLGKPTILVILQDVLMVTLWETAT